MKRRHCTRRQYTRTISYFPRLASYGKSDISAAYTMAYTGFLKRTKRYDWEES
jgi:hypothetical protein